MKGADEMFDIKENLKKLPDEPGVYLHKDRLGQVIYVGKAISLKRRVSQYFQKSKNMDPKVSAMVENVEEFEYIRCGNEVEALVLENNLIKKYQPKYNILLRDDKTYPYIKVTNEEWPRIVKTRKIVKDGSKYFGPYSDIGAVNQIVELLNNVGVLKKCSVKEFGENFKPCLNYHIGLCDGICQGRVDHDEYMKRVGNCVDFLSGHQSKILEYLQNKMMMYSENLEYEKAAEYRDYINAAKVLLEKQRVVLYHTEDADIILYAGKGNIVAFYLRNGMLSGRETFSMDTMDFEGEFQENREDVIEAFIKQYYGTVPNVPGEILLASELENKKVIEQFLQETTGHKVALNVPKKGEKKNLLDMAKRDAAEMIKNIDEKEKNKREREIRLKKDIDQVIRNARIVPDTEEYINQETGEIVELKFPEPDGRRRVESYDISNINGFDNVGAMVVYNGLVKERKSYRRFKIKSLAGGPDDYGAMAEVLERRINRALAGDKGFLPLPDLIVVDGGKGHVTTAVEVCRKLGVYMPIAGMAKDDFHRTQSLVFHPESLRGQGEFFCEDLKNNTMLFSYLGNIQEEVHRFAIEYHRSKRNSNMTKSVLDDIKGIGPKKRNSLLKHFGSINKISKANKEQLMEADGITENNASEIIKFFIDKKS